jgi:hypothetical protein
MENKMTDQTVARKLPAKREPESYVDGLKRLACNPDTPIDRAHQALDFIERIERRNAEQAYNIAMAAAQAEIPQVLRSIKTDRYKYAPLEAISEAIDPIIFKHGFTLSFGTDSSPLPGHYRVTCDVRHIAGHIERKYGDVPCSNTGPKGAEIMNVTQAWGSAMTYGRRNLTQMIFNVKLRNQDDDGLAASSSLISDEMIEMLKDKIAESNANLASFLKFMKVTRLSEISIGRYRAALDALAVKRAKAAKGGK